MTNWELINLMQKQLQESNNNKQIAIWIFNHFYHLQNSSDWLIIKNDEAIYVNDCLCATQEYINKKPLAKILGHTFFYRQKFYVHKNVLSPRVETEILVEQVFNFCKNKQNLHILDMCCGSGVIGLSLKKLLDNSNQIYLSDISDDAISNSIQNSQDLGLDVEIIKSDMFDNLGKSNFDVLVCNPPYIAFGEDIENEVKLYDPKLALFAKNNGLYFYEVIAKNIQHFMNKNCYLVALEIGHKQGQDVKKILLSHNKDLEISIIKDYNNLDRVIIARKWFDV